MIPRAEYRCHRCDKPMASVFMVDANDNEICRDCYDATYPVICEHCPNACPPDDRTPTKAGGFAHAACATRVAVAFGIERQAIFGRPPEFTVVKGGRS